MTSQALSISERSIQLEKKHILHLFQKSFLSIRSLLFLFCSMFFQSATAAASAAFAFEKDFSAAFYSGSSSSSNSSSSDYVWVWMTVMPLGFYLVSNALECYQFIAAWNVISRVHRMDLEILHFRKKNIVARRLEIDRAMQTKLFSDILLEPNQSTSCPICLGDFEASDNVSSACSKENPKKACCHMFHQDCIRSWLEKHGSCPCCRHSILQQAASPVHPLLRQ